MKLIKTNGALGNGGHVLLCVLLGLLISFSQAAGSPEEELSILKLRFESLKNRYKLLCNQYSELATKHSAPGFNCTECPDGWFQVGDQCFLLSTERNNWLNSSRLCAQSGGRLAKLTTTAQHEAVEKESRRIGDFNTFYWIGLSDDEVEGDWRWIDYSPLQNAFWDTMKSEPNNDVSQGPEGEDCAVLESYTQKWYDVPCSFSYFRICQKDATPLH